MERREFIALLGMAAAVMPAHAGAEPAPSDGSLTSRLAGTWSFASSLNTRRDGTVFDRWGSNPKGIFMFDAGGRYAQIIVGAESRVFGGKTYCAFGSYSVDAAKKTFTTIIDACSLSKFSGTAQTRAIIALTPDELKYWNPVTTSGTTAEVIWKRVT
jgi:hypothetical protein